MSSGRDREQRFIAYLEAFVEKEERGMLAALRRGLGKEPGTVAEMHRYVVPWLPDDASDWQANRWYIVASLFALHQGNWTSSESGRPTNLGASFARLKRETDSDSIERRFIAMLNCDADDLPQHLRHAISLLKSHEVKVDFAQLLRDLRWWGSDRRTVQRQWARSFWGRGEVTESAEDAPAAATATATATAE